ncbi:RNA polymerase II-associated protein 3 [Quillaja saponaria]|uniref:RNA polymerase II-associated protein 3 n=1 Tax=Quillaja saponaria TaxID=32244 RepID=A0AAD7VJI1_QUISA|nr:RNA polymerase II-associated protein 3 [Quillaja saponaria]
MDFQGFLSDLQDWELSLKDKNKKMKPQSHQKEKMGSSSRNTGLVSEDSTSRRETSKHDYSRSTSGKYDFLKKNNADNRFNSSYITEDVPDAASEKELGNEYFKQKKFKEAVDCYSRSIALSPSAVAYANRAMAYLKLRRYQEAEDDCTEAVNLDDRYIKAYSRRATARKELKKLKQSVEDAEFALRLEPNNQEVKKQYNETKSLYDKELLQKVSGALRSSVPEKVDNSETKVNGHGVCPVSSTSQKSRVAEVQDQTKVNDPQFPGKASVIVEEVDKKNMRPGGRIEGKQMDNSQRDGISNSTVDIVKRNQRTSKQEVKASVEELASRAAARAKAEAAKNITAPTSAYQFEISWRGLAGDLALQACLLKAISPHALPEVFKSSLSATLLLDIIKCIASFFTEEMGLAIDYLKHLTKVPRFDLLIMFLSSKDRDGIRKIWDEVFCNEATPIEYSEILDNLRSEYDVRQ